MAAYNVLHFAFLTEVWLFLRSCFGTQLCLGSYKIASKGPFRFICREQLHSEEWGRWHGYSHSSTGRGGGRRSRLKLRFGTRPHATAHSKTKSGRVSKLPTEHPHWECNPPGKKSPAKSSNATSFTGGEWAQCTQSATAFRGTRHTGNTATVARAPPVPQPTLGFALAPGAESWPPAPFAAQSHRQPGGGGGVEVCAVAVTMESLSGRCPH